MARDDQDNVTLDVEDTKKVFSARASFYRLLSGIYYLELTQEQIDDLAVSDLDACLGGDELFDEGIADIKRYLKIRNSGTRQELAVDYARCIIGAGALKDTHPTMPYESLYTGKEALLMQDARDEVFRAFKKSRLRLAEGVDVPDDHISFTLEYLAILTDRSFEAYERNDVEGFRDILETQRDFLENHMLNWIDRFCADFRDMAETRFYRGIAKVTQAFLHNEYDLVGELIEGIQADVVDKEVAQS